MSEISLKGMSSEQLRALAKRATTLAHDLDQEKPSYTVALENGIEDETYPTPRDGMVSSYRGTVEITMPNGKKWKAVGHGPRGDAYSVYSHGYIEFIPIEV